MSYYFHYNPANIPCYRNVSEQCDRRNARGDSIVPGGGFVDQCNVATSFVMQSKYAFSDGSNTRYAPIPRDFLSLTHQPWSNPNIVPSTSLADCNPNVCKRIPCHTDVKERFKPVCFKCEANRVDSIHHSICHRGE